MCAEVREETYDTYLNSKQTEETKPSKVSRNSVTSTQTILTHPTLNKTVLIIRNKWIKMIYGKR